MNKVRNIILIALGVLCCLWGNNAAAATIYDSPYVSFSPDGKAWTTCAGDKSSQHYSSGTTVYTNVTSSIGTLKTGSHYYSYERAGTVPIEKWVVGWPYAKCIHNNYSGNNSFHGVIYGTSKCLQNYNSGWLPYCADCGKLVAQSFTYMTRQAAATIGYMEMGVGYAYYFCCPHCNNLEQGVNLGTHVCRQVSWNQYRVDYNANTNAIYSGSMTPSYHMYNNAEYYEGRKITPVTALSKNCFRRSGYEFLGWNTKPDGSGTFYEDGAEILNLTTKDCFRNGSAGVVTLYAQWSSLQLHARDNYEAYDGIGAVDLHWEQQGHQEKLYRLYQSSDKKEWLPIMAADKIGDSDSLGGGKAVFFETMSLADVIAADTAAPDGIFSDKQAGTGDQTDPVQGFGGNAGGKIKIVWQKPEDNGTTYYHMAESYTKADRERLCCSNITENTLITGVQGYYYLVDGKRETLVTADNGTYTAQPEVLVQQTAATRYLHVAAVDGAGNISETAHIDIEELNITWVLHTRNLKVADGKNVYYAETQNLYYVRADGETPFSLTYRAYMEDAATKEYQPNYVIWETLSGDRMGRNIIYVPNGDLSGHTSVIEGAQLQFSTQGTVLLEQLPDTAVVRKDYGREIEAEQKFLVGQELSGVQMQVVPIVGAMKDQEVVYSDYFEDWKNGIVLMADGEAPELRGMESLESLHVIDREAGEVLVNISASDGLSGVRDFYVKVVNKDNGQEKIYRGDIRNTVSLAITGEEMIFAGDFTVTAYARDNVGNVTEISYDTTEFALKVRLERILEPHEPIFKRGESGILSIIAIGYAERVEVEFSEELAKLNPDLNTIYYYDSCPEYQKQEQLQFMIPLDAGENADYTITVRAYKGDSRLEEYPKLAVLEVSGSILDDIRTRLR